MLQHTKRRNLKVNANKSKVIVLGGEKGVRDDGKVGEREHENQRSRTGVI